MTSLLREVYRCPEASISLNKEQRKAMKTQKQRIEALEAEVSALFSLKEKNEEIISKLSKKIFAQRATTQKAIENYQQQTEDTKKLVRLARKDEVGVLYATVSSIENLIEYINFLQKDRTKLREEALFWAKEDNLVKAKLDATRELLSNLIQNVQKDPYNSTEIYGICMELQNALNIDFYQTKNITQGEEDHEN